MTVRSTSPTAKPSTHRNSSASVPTGDGRDGFDHGIPSDIGDAPNALLVADVNDDGVRGRPAGRAASKTGSVLPGTGNGDAGPKHDFIVAGTPTSITARGCDGVAAIAADPARSWSVMEMAAVVGESPRNFHRRFLASIGTTPARSVERLRAEMAYALLRTTSARIGEVALRCGFGSEVSMRRAMSRWHSP